ncbi:allophanate hydrolase [Cohnella hashimotonis]|uniref:Allophanate hydrolase n=1 Tax=Cohnella hashimotonis TaxID=2826895 RepID=A0ABT6TA69_9BACL|nr:allophanate hydrolase [Cohnella hashimotonis]MDI4643728.1 allophanate hydrolase [Cohnella hashimotonis]
MSETAFEFEEQLTVEWLKKQYASGRLTPRDVAAEIVRRAEADRDMNIWISPPTLAAIEPYLARLDELDPKQAPLWGIPFAVKDNIDVANVPTTAGCPDYAYVPSAHATVVRRLIESGAIPVGKTNLDQFATGLVGMRSPYGEARNALRPELISGGSSSGSAVAVARGQAAFALGTDTAGSGRVPAALNGLVGWKPSVGAWPVAGMVPACESLDCITVFAHRLDEADLVDRTARGLAPEDPWSKDIPRRTGSARSLPAKVYLPSEQPAFYGPFAEGYRLAWERAKAQLERLGIAVEYVNMALFEEAAALLYEGPWVAERWAALGEFVETHPGSAFPVTERILRTGADPAHHAAGLFKAQHRLQGLKRQAQQLLEGGALVMPTAGGTWTREEARQDPIASNRAMGLYTNHCNLLDLCAIAVPAGLAGEKLPFGITLFALSGQEDLLVGLAERYGLAQGQAKPEFKPEMETETETPTEPKAEPNPVPNPEPKPTPQAESNPEPKAEPKPTPKAEPNPVPNPEPNSEPATLVAVCGLHMRGFPLEAQMNAHGATFIREAHTAAKYKLVRLHTQPAKPGLLKQTVGGVAIALELWAMPLARFGSFATAIPAPLGIGKVELADGTEVPGFICEGWAEREAEDITAFGGWRAAMATPATVE